MTRPRLSEPLFVRVLLRSRLVLPLLLLQIGGACTQSVSEVSGPTVPPDTVGGGGTVQRATVNIGVTVDPTDLLIAAQIGETSGVLQGVWVILQSSGAGSILDSALTDPTGNAEFVRVIPGTYSVSVLRSLSTAERQMLDSSDADVTAFAGGIALQVSAPMTSGQIAVIAGRRGSLVISEIFEYSPPTAEWLGHPFGSYLELANNSDTVIFLDGKLLGHSLPQQHQDFSTFPCATTEPWRMDPDGLWAYNIWQIPGSGTEYPLSPGGVALIATDAMDHRVFNPSLLDLSAADFEAIGTSEDIDNPFVPNVRPVGGSNGPLGHGIAFNSSPSVTFIAERVSIGSLPSGFVATSTLPVWRIPMASILDVFSTFLAPGVFDAATPECQPFVNPSLDRQRARLSNTSREGSIRRRAAAVLSSGQIVLQRTSNSDRDFERSSSATPGQLP